MATAKTLKTEATNAPVNFTFDGVEFTVPSAKRWPLKVMRAQLSGDYLGSIELLLGDQWKLFDPDEERTVEDLEGLVEALFKAVDVEPGK